MLYGEGGIGGAINIIPRKPERERSGDVRVLPARTPRSSWASTSPDRSATRSPIRVDYSNSQSDNWVESNGDSDAEMLRRPCNGTSATTSRCRRATTVGDQSPMRVLRRPRQRDGYGDFVDATSSASNFNVGDSRSSASRTTRFAWKRIGARRTPSVLQAQLYQLTSDRYWRNAETYFLEGPD